MGATGRRTPERKAPATPGRTLLKVLLGIVGVALSAVLVASAFYRFDLSGGGLRLVPRFSLPEFFAALPGHLRWLVVFMALTAAILPLRALQWQRTLPKYVPFRDRYHLVAIGAFTHNVLPGKLGEFIRSFLMARTYQMPFIQALGSVAVCKLLEFAALMLLVAASFLGPFGEVLGHFEGALRVAVGVCVALVIFVVLLAHYSAPLGRELARRGRLPKAQVFLHNVSDGLGTARSFRGMAVALLYSIGPVLAPALAYGLALRGLGIRGGIFAGAVVLGAIALGQSTPGIPAGMGIYYFVTSWAARELGATPEAAAAFSVLTHVSTVLTMVVVGGISVLKKKLRWKDLRRRAHVASDAAHHVTDVEDPEPARA
ncbi:MAG: flippase-like domain-containing protein [Myxococcaceae bacterium]|nr:flippase-like domain-containing protein [Myxococcaceae bacterium]MCI0669288.1 flippase-like domain-containing protein [Myxococcaceae bacterium]